LKKIERSRKISEQAYVRICLPLVKVTTYDGEDFTKISFKPDFDQFGVNSLTNDIAALFRKRALDIAGTTAGITVFLDGEKIELDTELPFKSYCELYLNDPESLIYTVPQNPEAQGRWEVGIALSDQGFHQTSFVNSIATNKGGQHINVVLDQIVKDIHQRANKKLGKNDIKVYFFPLKFPKTQLVALNCPLSWTKKRCPLKALSPKRRR